MAFLCQLVYGYVYFIIFVKLHTSVCLVELKATDSCLSWDSIISCGHTNTKSNISTKSCSNPWKARHDGAEGAYSKLILETWFSFYLSKLSFSIASVLGSHHPPYRHMDSEKNGLAVFVQTWRGPGVAPQ